MATKRKSRGAIVRPGLRTGESVRVLIPHARVESRLKELAREIRRDFPKERLHLIGVLKGCVFFLADLARELGGEV